MSQNREHTSLRRVGAQSGDVAPRLDVVFVHGLGGDGQATWGGGERESWLKWLTEDIPEIAVWALEYPAESTKWTSRGEGMAIPDRASNLISTLLYYGIGSRNTLYVCHSLGGLIVKQILRHSVEMAKPDWACIADTTVGVAFLATPHSGSSLATFAKVVTASRPTRTTLALTAHCPHLKELGDWYRQNAARLGIETVAYTESQKLRGTFRSFTVVTATSADPGVDGCIATSIDADHVSIAKPRSREHDTYRGVETFIRRQVAKHFVTSDEHSVAEAPETPAFTTPPPPPDLVRQIRELQAMRELDLLDGGEVSAVKMGILNNYYGVRR